MHTESICFHTCGACWAGGACLAGGASGPSCARGACVAGGACLAGGASGPSCARGTCVAGEAFLSRGAYRDTDSGWVFGARSGNKIFLNEKTQKRVIVHKKPTEQAEDLLGLWRR